MNSDTKQTPAVKMVLTNRLLPRNLVYFHIITMESSNYDFNFHKWLLPEFLSVIKISNGHIKLETSRDINERNGLSKTKRRYVDTGEI